MEERIGMQFTKMQGLGSSYILFNLLEDSMENVDFSKLSKLVTDVNIGIGSDGMLLIGPSNRADFRMRVFDQEGTEADHCLIGLQCVAAYLYDTMYAETTSFTIETLGGDISIKVELGEKRKVKTVMVWDQRNQVWTNGEVNYVCYGELETMNLPRT